MDENNAPSRPDLGSPTSDLKAAAIERRRGINADWQASLKLLPEDLKYFFSVVEAEVPRDLDAEMKIPTPLSTSKTNHFKRLP